MWHIQVNSLGIVTSYGDNMPPPREGVTNYKVASIPDHESGDVLVYDNGVITVDSTERITGQKAELEPKVLTAYRAWQDALAIPLDCAPMCEAEYLALKAEYDAL